MILIWLLVLFSRDCYGFDEIYRTSKCYGDSSGSGLNNVEFGCSTGLIFIHDIIAGRKPKSLGCPDEDHASNPVNQGLCCSYSDSDCLVTFSGDWSLFQTQCNHRQSCSGIPVIRDENECDRNEFDRFSNYMTIEYFCVPPGYNFGPCNTTLDCTDPAAVCNKSYCVCQDGYTTFNAFDDCWQDGALNGSCTGPVGCQDANTMCNFTTGRCVCDSGYIALNGSCVRGGYNGGYCTDTADCTDVYALCDKSVCLCVSGYTAFADFDDCWKDGSLNGSCGPTVNCEGSNTLCDSSTSRCSCSAGYSPFDGVCYADNTLNGACSGPGSCTQDNTECKETSGRCECFNMYTAYNNICYKDGSFNGSCSTSSDCTDSNTVCFSGTGRCICKTGSSEYKGACYEDGEIYGLCNRLSDCKDNNTRCENGRCQCVVDFRKINGTCREDGTLGGFCNESIVCGGTNVVCNLLTNVCKCDAGTSNYNDVCHEDGKLFGDCTGTKSCTTDNTVCSPTSGRCFCDNGFSAYNGDCYQGGALHGYCVSNTDCDLSPLTRCVNGRCECLSGYSDINDHCRQDGSLGGACEVDIDCDDDNTVCDAGGSPRVCVCVDAYTDIDGACELDGGLDGLCTVDTDCSDSNAQCIQHATLTDISICVCIDGYTNILGICMEDNRLGGRCTGSDSCLDNNTSCSGIGVCVCQTEFAVVNDECVEVGSNGGVCDTGEVCQDANADCVQDIDGQCNNVNCDPGLCQCKAGYTLGHSGLCIKDGELNGKCRKDRDCVDENANCDSVHFICLCSITYSEYQGVCIEDGFPSGNCLSDGTCQGFHSVCVDGKCICNDVRHYTLTDGNCNREDGYINGDCSQTPCHDPNAECVSSLCKCVTGYVETNGVCTKRTISSVTSCDGSSPYNQLDPDCDEYSTAVILDNFVNAKPASGCSGEMNTYVEEDFIECCSYAENDCRIHGSGPDACGTDVLSGAYTTYNVLEYTCVPDESVISVGENNDVSSNVAYITSPTSELGTTEENCSVQANCQTDIVVYGDFVMFNQENTVCTQYLVIGHEIFDCTNSSLLPRTYTSGYFTVTLTNPDVQGRFVLRIEAADTNADITVACGSRFQSPGWSPTNGCNVAGLLGGPCLPSGACQDSNAVCEDGICVCDSGYAASNGVCKPKDTVIAIIAGIVGGLLFLGVVAAVVLLRKTVKRKFCPGKPDEKNLVESSPMNVKYQRGLPAAVVTPSIMPVPWKKSDGWSPMNGKFNQRKSVDLPRAGVLPPIIPKGVAPSSTAIFEKPKPKLGKNMTITDYLHKEQMEADKKEKLKNEEKKKKILKKLKKARIGIMAKRGFDLPKHPIAQTNPGVFKSNSNLHHLPQTLTVKESSGNADIPYIHPRPADVPAPHPPPNRLPPVREPSSFDGSSYLKQMNGDAPHISDAKVSESATKTDLRSSVRSVMSLSSSMKGSELFRRHSILEISPVDNTSNVEQTEPG